MGLYINGKLVGISLPQTGGGQPINNQDITVTENGTYEAEEGYTGLGEVTVNVPSMGQTITAKNTLNSSVSLNEKVWIEPPHLETNFTLLGGSINNRILTVSNWKEGIKAYVPSFTFPSQSLELLIKVRFSSFNFSYRTYLRAFAEFLETSSVLTTVGSGGMQFIANALSSYFSMAYTNQSGNAASAGFIYHSSLQTNTWYYIKVTMDSSSSHTYYSSDGINWTTASAGSYPSNTGPSSSKFKGKYVLLGGICSQDGAIGSTVDFDLNECYVKINGNLAWTPYTDHDYEIIPSKDIKSSTVAGITSESIETSNTGGVNILTNGSGTYEPSIGSKTINYSGTYNASSDNLYGFSSVTVDMPIGYKEITANGDYSAYDDELVGYSYVFVNVPGCPREIVNGVLRVPTTITNVYDYYIVEISDNGLNHYMPDNTGLASVRFSYLERISGKLAMSHAFSGCYNLATFQSPYLTSITGEKAMEKTFEGCTNLSSITWTRLNLITGNYAFYETFFGCTGLTSLSFPALTSNSFGNLTNQFYNMLNGCNNVTVHFPSNLQAVIENWADVQNGFGGTNTTILYDLTATE